MGFATAVRTVFSKYVTFTGRARRSEYWWWGVFAGLISAITAIIDAVVFKPAAGDVMPVNTLASLLLFLPGLAVSVRRLHDTGRSGWWMLLGLIPLLGWIVLTVFCVQDSAPGVNQHGPSPKYPGGMPGQGLGGPGAYPSIPGQYQGGYPAPAAPSYPAAPGQYQGDYPAPAAPSAPQAGAPGATGAYGYPPAPPTGYATPGTPAPGTQAYPPPPQSYIAPGSTPPPPPGI